MSIFNRKKDSTDPIPEDLKPYYEGKNTTWKRWVGPVMRGLLLCALLVLFVWGGIWSVNKVIHRNDDTSTASTSSSNSDSSKSSSTDNKDSGSAKTTPPPAAAKPSPSPSTPPPAAPAPKTPAAPTTTPAPVATAPTPAVTPTPAPATNADGSLANTGPGEVIAAFVGTVVLATVGFYFFRAYQLSGSQE